MTKTVKVTWHQAKQGGQCDFCPRPTEGDCPYIDFAVTTRLPSGDEVTMPGPWGLCPRCTTLLDLKPGDGSVDEGRATDRHVHGMIEISLNHNMPPKVIKTMVSATSWGPDPAPAAKMAVYPGVYIRADGMVEVSAPELASYMELPETDERVRERAVQLLQIYGGVR